MLRPITPFGRLVRTLAAVATVLAAAATAACFRSDTVIHVKADGTGTIEQTNLANKQMLGMAAGMAKSAAQEAGADASKTPSLDNIGDLFDEARIREQASTFGEGVRFVSSEPLTQDGLTGVKAVFAFEDVRLLNLSNGRSATGGAAPQLRFDLQRAADGGSTLRIRLPEGARPAAPPDAAATTPPATTPPRQEIPPEALAMVRNMFKGARLTVGVEVDGAIVTTDAPSREGSRVTVFGLDFEQLLSDPAKFAALQGMKPGADFATVRKALEGVPGVVMPATPTVSVEFR
jgi:hypothetical protein